MKFLKTKLNGVFIIEIEKNEDERGFFARIWDKKKFQELGLNTNIHESSISHNNKKGTLRGMHYQIIPYEEAKIVNCIKGKIFDVVIDLRKNSETLNQWIEIELNENDHKMIYIPEGFAHGFQTLHDDTTVFYQISEKYMPEYARGIRWDDPKFKINWPILPPIISDRDKKFELYIEDEKK